MDVKWMANLVRGIAVLMLVIGTGTSATFKVDQTQSTTFDAISVAVDALVNSLGWSKDDVKISNIDTEDAKFGQTVIYEFDIQAGDAFLPLRLSEEITSWQYLVELPSGEEDSLGTGAMLATIDDKQQQTAVGDERIGALTAVLAPFQLSGPVELWIQDAEQLRLALPNDVEAGVLRKVLLADGAVVTVEGAREVSLEHPLQLPLPLPSDSRESGLAASLLALADRLRYASRMEQMPLLSLRIVGPTSLVATVPKELKPSGNSLKVKRLAPGAVELVSRKQGQVQVEGLDPLPALDPINSWMFPLPSLNGTNSKLQNLEKLLISFLGPKAYQKGSFKLLRAKASAATFVQVEFQIEKRLSNDNIPTAFWPEWKTRPTVQRLDYQLLAKVEGQKLLPVHIHQLEHYTNVESYTWRAITGNVSFSKLPRILLPSSPLTLDPKWEGIAD
eukprot:c23885_g1_i1 orf=539-1876(+)